LLFVVSKGKVIAELFLYIISNVSACSPNQKNSKTCFNRLLWSPRLRGADFWDVLWAIMMIDFKTFTEDIRDGVSVEYQNSSD